MKNIVRFSLAALLMVALSSCINNDVDKALEAKKSFETQTEFGIYKDGKYTFAYNDKDYQIVYNESRKTVRLQKDDMTEYAIVTLNSTPAQGATVEVSVQGKGVTAVKNASMEVIKTSTDCIWLWDKPGLTGYILYWEL